MTNRMMIVVTGGSGSGKSAYAEEICQKVAAGEEKYYIATMRVFGEEGKAKVERHRQMRAGKGFLTIEQPRDLKAVALKVSKQEKRIALLECMSNLVANEMFLEEKICPCEQVVAEVMQGIEALQANFTHLVIVTNNVFEDGIDYDPSTREYMRALGIVNQRLATMADQVFEVVVGIPVQIK